MEVVVVVIGVSLASSLEFCFLWHSQVFCVSPFSLNNVFEWDGYRAMMDGDGDGCLFGVWLFVCDAFGVVEDGKAD
jgi:hypothetical protein